MINHLLQWVMLYNFDSNIIIPNLLVKKKKALPFRLSSYENGNYSIIIPFPPKKRVV